MENGGFVNLCLRRSFWILDLVDLGGPSVGGPWWTKTPVAMNVGVSDGLKWQSSLADKVVAKHRADMRKAKQQMLFFLAENGFPESHDDFNSLINQKKTTEIQHTPFSMWKFSHWFSQPKEQITSVTFTYPLHVAVKQNNALITWELLYFGANPLKRDSQGYTAFACAEGQKMIQIFETFLC